MLSVRQINKFLNSILLICLFGIVLSFYYFYKSNFIVGDKASKGKIDRTTASKVENIDSRVNQYMLRAQALQNIATPQIHNNMISQGKKSPNLSPNDIKPEDQIWKDPATNSAGDGAGSLRDTASGAMYNEQVEFMQQKQEREFYKQQLIENARQQGFHITVSDDLKVLSVRPIKNPTQQDTFESDPAD